MADTTRPNVLFLLSDEHSFRCLSRLNPDAEGEPVNTPMLDALADRGIFFETAYCQVPLCTPSRICMLTGLSPMRSGGWGNTYRLKPERTIASTFADAGYETCLIGKMHLGGDRQFVGFRHRPYGDMTGGTGHQWEPLARSGGRGMRSRTEDAGITEIPESQLQERIVAEETVAFLREQRHRAPEQPWFLMASFSRPHFPLTAPRRHFDRYWPNGVTPPKIGRTGDTADHPMTQGMARGFKTEEIDDEESRRARAAYFACVDFLDELLADLMVTLEREGLLDNTIVVYTSDHGELMGEHGMWWKNSWHEGAARVPLIVQLPEHRRDELPHQLVKTPVSLADLYPTLCGLAGIAAPEGLDGVDLSFPLKVGSTVQRDPVVCLNPTPRWGEGCEHVVVRGGRYKYVRFRGVEPNLLFDLVADPLEQDNLIDSDNPAHCEAAERLAQVADAAWDFDAAERQMAEDGALGERHPLGGEGAEIPRAGNLYVMHDGRLVDAETPLYQPRVIIEDPSAAIADWPGNGAAT